MANTESACKSLSAGSYPTLLTTIRIGISVTFLRPSKSSPDTHFRTSSRIGVSYLASQVVLLPVHSYAVHLLAIARRAANDSAGRKIVEFAARMFGGGYFYRIFFFDESLKNTEEETEVNKYCAVSCNNYL